jgi:hypothetical protein
MVLRPFRRETNIVVKDYPFKGEYAFGHWYREIGDKDYFVMDDGDVYSEEELRKRFKVLKLHSEEIIDKFKEELK